MSNFYYYPHLLDNGYWGRRRLHNPLTNYANSYYGMNKYCKQGSLDPLYKGERGKSENLNNFSKDTSQEGAEPSFWLESCYQPSVAMPWLLALSWVAWTMPSEQDGSHTAWLSQLLKWIYVLPTDHSFYPWGGGWSNHGTLYNRVLFFVCFVLPSLLCNQMNNGLPKMSTP